MPFENIESLLEETNYQIAINPGSSIQNFFQYSNDPIVQEAWLKRIKPYITKYKELKNDWGKSLVMNPNIALYFVEELGK